MTIRHLAPRAVPVALVLVLAGCAGGPDLSVRGGAAGLLAVPGALDAAGAAFVGPGVPGSGTGGLAGFDRSLLRAGSATPLRQTATRQVELGAVLRRPLGPVAGGALVLEGSVRLGLSQAAWHLPQGIGVFTDPMDIRVTSRTLTPELRLVHETPLAGAGKMGAGALALFAGAGAVLTDSRVRARSALIALDVRHRETLPYLVLGAGVWHPLPGQGRAGVEAQVSGHPGRGAQARLVLDLAR